MSIENDPNLKKLTSSQLGYANCESLGFLSGKKYNIADLEYIVIHTAVKLRTIVITQTLTSEFCKNYILNDEYIIFDGDDFNIEEIIHYQPHLRGTLISN